MTALDESISALRVALVREPTSPVGARWSNRVRRRLGRVRRLLTAATERPSPTETGANVESCWLSPRAAREERQRQALLTRIGEWEPTLRAAGTAQPGTVRGALLRLTSDLEHHQRRSRLLAFDTVAMELGGSE